MKSVMLIACTLALFAAPQKKDDPELLLQSAIQTETVDGDLKSAIEQYKKIIARANAPRGVVANAMVRLGLCYEKQGNAEARKQFERVVREFGEQKDSVAMARSRLGSGSATPGNGISARQVWSVPPELRGDLYSGTVSPDGRYIPFTNWSQNGDLFLHDLTTGANRRLTNTGSDERGKPSEFAEETCFSRDGKQLAYTWSIETKHRPEVRIVDLQGSGIPQPRRLYDNENVKWIYVEDWSPDGKSIAVQITRTDRTAQIGLISVADGSLRVLKSVDWRHSSKMFFSPDGRYLAFDSPTSDTSTKRDVFVLATDGSREIPAVVDQANDTVMGWSPDGKFLLFASDRSGSTDLWALPFKDGKLAAAPERIKKDIGNIEPRGLSRSGAFYYAVFSRNVQARTDIRTAKFDFESGRLVYVPVEAAPGLAGSNSQPSWSPDGKYLAFISQPPSESTPDQTLVIRASDNGQIRFVRVKMESFGYTRWSPDGRSLAMVGRDFKGRRGVFQVNAQSGDIALIAEGNLNNPIWAPDGKRLYFIRNSRNLPMSLVAKDLASGTETDLFKGKSLGFMSLSPDGRHIGVMASEDPSGKQVATPITLYLIPVAGGEPRELIRRPALGAVQFSPDGRYIASGCTDPSTKSRVIFVVPAQGGEVRELMRMPESQGVGVAMWAPDSRSLFTRSGSPNRGKTDFWRIPLDGGEHRRIEITADDMAGPFLVSPDGRQLAFATTTQSGPTPARTPDKEELWVLENFLPVSASK